MFPMMSLLTRANSEFPQHRKHRCFLLSQEKKSRSQNHLYWIATTYLSTIIAVIVPQPSQQQIRRAASNREKCVQVESTLQHQTGGQGYKEERWIRSTMGRVRSLEELDLTLLQDRKHSGPLESVQEESSPLRQAS